MSQIKALLIKHEAVRFKPYLDSKGKVTIGVGRNLEDVGLTPDEVMFMLDSDIARVRREALGFSWFGALDDARKDVVLSMLFNLGLDGFKGFRGMIAALQKKDYDRAASEMMNSVWASQVKRRAVELADMMKTGEYAP